MKLFKFLFKKRKEKYFSHNAIEHSNKGTWVGKSKERLDGGGHGEKALTYLKNNNIKYNIVKTYDNGVRVGNIPTHKDIKKRSGTNQSWFPNKWDDKIIENAGTKVFKRTANSSRKFNFGYYRRVKVGIVRDKEKITTVFPDSKQTDKKGRERKWK